MAKRAISFVCQNCGTVHSRWVGKCDGCGEWNTIVEDYAVSEKYLASFVEASRALMEREGFDPQVVLYLCGSPAERMVKMLADQVKKGQQAAEARDIVSVMRQMDAHRQLVNMGAYRLNYRYVYR
mgnify:CR=1 FL=1